MTAKQLLEIVSSSKPFVHVLDKINEQRDFAVTGTPFIAQALITASLFTKTQRPILFLMPDEKAVKLFTQDLQSLLGENQALFFPSYNRQMWNELGPPSTLVGHRLRVLKSLVSKENKILVAQPGALLEKVSHPDIVIPEQILLKTGEDMDFDTLIQKLVKMGYVREDRIDRPGEMSVRGGLIDVFLFESEMPYRIEFFGDEVDSIRKIDIDTQKSTKRIDKIDIFPLYAAGMYGPYDDHPEDHVLFDAAFLDYLPENALICFADYATVSNDLDNYESDMNYRMQGFAHEHKIASLKYHDFYLGYKTLLKQANDFLNIEFALLQQTFSDKVAFQIKTAPFFAGKFDLFKKELDQQISTCSVDSPLYLYCCDSESQASRISDLLVQEDMPRELKSVVLNISEGMLWSETGLYLYTNKELYSRNKLPKQDRIDRRKVSLRDLSAMNYGDFVVHEDYGIGIFRGLKKIKAYGKDRECLLLEYQDKDSLYVPLEKMHKVQKYSGKDGAVPQLNKLGTSSWEKLKKRTKQNIKDVAAQLIKLYASRKMQKGHAFQPDTIWQKELEASFEFDETQDQLNAIEEIKNDMESEKSMDRLICGDVGFGKTEVAIRAAFKAINDGKQVAVLVPTTILAQQHLNTFSERLRPFPVSVDMLSRFRTPNQQKAIIEKTSKGELDLLVGTHRILSKDIKFKNLGLLIIDEEQRFGVMHKEKLKLLKASVDTLSMSATPIPRTMHMSLMGAKDMSLINTPPQNRIPIKTEVARFDRDYIREIILKEIDRGGQVFFVHNRVQSIYGISNLVREIVPEVSIAVAHGQMKGHELEKVMMAFSSGKVQCLVCTMIIESGIDMPNTNTLIINRADKLGLAQLYQLRGRVGRSDLQAYAYLLVPPLRKLSQTAIKRLQTIQELSYLGSGYNVAMRDLEIRGTGNIFGAQQSGFVEALGYDVYMKIIEEAIYELKKEMNIEQKERREPLFEPQIELRMDAFLPGKYIMNPSERVDIYRRLAEAETPKAVQNLEKEIKDRFGPLPEPAKVLVDYILIKIYAEHALVSKLRLLPDKIFGLFATDFLPIGEQFREWFGNIVAKSAYKFELKQTSKDLYFEIKTSPKEDQLKTAKNFLQSIQ